MQKILLIGDSIRQGYDSFTKKAFDGLADVVYPSENCRFTSYIVRNIADWADALGCDENTALVHWNAGLWDDLTMFDGEKLISPEEYEQNILRIDGMLRRLFPKAVLIFATSTPVREHLFAGRRNHRLNRDTERYNEIAARVLSPKGVIINDLYSLMCGVPSEYYTDMTHFYTKDGTRVITSAVCDCIGKALHITPKTLDYDALFSQKTDAVGV